MESDQPEESSAALSSLQDQPKVHCRFEEFPAMKMALKDRTGSTKSNRSLRRQRRVKSIEAMDVRVDERPACTSSTSSAHSIPALSRASSAHTTSPMGDFPIETLAERSMLRKAAWFLSHNVPDSQDKDRSRGLYSVGRTIQRTGSQLRKTRLFHLFYILVLPIYTAFGAWIFQALDGEHDDRMVLEYKHRCDMDRNATLESIRQQCDHGADCFTLMKDYFYSVEKCYRDWHAVNRTVVHSMGDYTNALVYAFSVYTTIGYGNMAADTPECRIATIIYGALGIPLFFAFVKEEGNLFRTVFISTYNRLRGWKKKNCRCPYDEEEEDCVCTHPDDAEKGEREGANAINGSPRPVILISESDQTKRARFARKQSTGSLFGQSGKLRIDEQRRVFLSSIFVFILHILLASLVFSLTTEFDYLTSVYFLFNSVALIGFGDVFPKHPRAILYNAGFIILGVVLFSMCYFILQEEIRTKAFEASRRARISISKYSHTIMQQARGGWSRRNSPLLESSPDTAFERLRKRRQSAPAVTLTVPDQLLPCREV